jgi:hypothetical protein
MVMFIGEAEVQKCSDWNSLIATMETALIGFSAGIQPVRTIGASAIWVLCPPSLTRRWD